MEPNKRIKTLRYYKKRAVNSVLGLLHSVAVGDPAAVSEVHDASILRVKVCRLVTLKMETVPLKCWKHHLQPHGVTMQEQKCDQ